MSLTLTLQNALSGLNVAQQALGVTAHNVANANTPGFTRKALPQEARIVGGAGQGVSAGALARSVDDFLIRELRLQASTVGRAAALSRYHGRIQDMFGTPGDQRGLGSALGRLAQAVEAFANAPESAALAFELTSAASELALRLRQDAAQVQELRREADREIAATVVEINGELAELHRLNAEIGRQHALGQSTADLEDRRDAMVRGLGEKLDIHTYVMDGNRLAVVTGDGTALLDAEPRVLVYETAGFVDGDTVFGALRVYARRDIDPASGKPLPGAQGSELVSSGVRAVLTPEQEADGAQAVTTSIRSGRLAGLLEMRDRILPELDDQLQELATVLRFALNAAHSDAVPLPPPASLTGTRSNMADYAAADRSGTAYLAVVVVDGATLATIAVDLGAASPAALAAQIDAALGGLGTATIDAAGRLDIRTADPAHGLALARGDGMIRVEDAAGRELAYGFADYFGLNDLLVQAGSRPSDLALRADIEADPARLGTARLEVEPGSPPQASLGGQGDNRGAQGLAAALSGSHDFIARGGLPSARSSLAAYAADIVATAASRAAQATAARERAFALIDDLELRAGEQSGVSIDEEMARLIIYQRAYLAAARLVSVTDELFEALIAMKR